MSGEVCLPDKSQIAREILAYLRKHPEAQDTLDGILQSWLSGRKDRYTPTRVREVVKDLVLEGTIVENKLPGSNTAYGLNLARRNSMKKLSKHAGGKE